MGARQQGSHLRHQGRQGEGRVVPLLRLAGVGPTARHADGEPPGRALAQAVPKDHAALRIAAQVVEGVDLRDVPLRQQGRRSGPSLSRLLRLLEDQVDGPGALHGLQLQGQATEGGAVPVVAALVRDARTLRRMGERDGLRDRQGVHVRAEGDGRRPLPVSGGVEPPAAVHHRKRRVRPDEVHQAPLRPALVHRELRVRVQLVAQLHNLLQVLPVHFVASLPGACSGPATGHAAIIRETARGRLTPPCGPR